LTFILVRFLAFIGIYKFGKDHLGIEEGQNGFLFLIAACFACLPFFIIHGLTVAGIPLVSWAFFNIYKKTKVTLSYLTLLLFVLWSNFVLVGFHVLFCFGALFIYLSVKDKKIHFNLLGALVFIAVMYVLSDYMLFYMHLFNKSYHSSRGEMDKFLGLNFFGVAGGTFKTAMSGDYSTANYFGLVALPVLICGLLYTLRSRTENTSFIFLLFFVLIFFCAFFINLLDWNKFSFFYKQFPFAKEFNFKRFTSLVPGFFFILLLTASVIVYRRHNTIIKAGASLLFLLLFIAIWRGNISYNRSAFDTRGVKIISEQQTTFSEFFDPELYQRIKASLGSTVGSNVVHYGLSPSASKLAGLNVLDDYQGDYPKEYKSEFRSVIAAELDKSQKLKKYFDEWGSRCYLESAKSFEGRLDSKLGFPFDPQLDINTTQLKNMNCSAILSSIIIGNAAELHLELKQILVSHQTPGKTIFLYTLS
ncbi:MAG: DUF6044 family protein, partial [Bacteroidia bacterium]